MEKKEERICRRSSNNDNCIKLTHIVEEYMDEKTRELLVVAAQEQEMLHEWDLKYMLPRIEEFHDILAYGVNESWKILLNVTEKQFDFKIYLNEVNNYLLLVVSAKNGDLDMIDSQDPIFSPLSETAFAVGEKIRQLLLIFKNKPTLLITGYSMGGFLAQFTAFNITYCFMGKDGRVQIRETPSEDFVTYTVVFESPPSSDKNPTSIGPLKSEDITIAITNVFKPCCKEFVDCDFDKISQKQFFRIKKVFIDQNAMTYKHQTTEGLVEWDRKEIPTSFFTNNFMEQLRQHKFLSPMCPELVEKIAKFRLLDSYILIEDENVTLEEFIPRTHQVLSKFKDVIDSEMFADKDLEELYEVLTEKTRKDTHCLIMNEEGKRAVQQWPDGTVIRGFQSYEEMRFYACLYYNSIQNCFFCSFENFIQMNAETINNFASKTKPTIILIVDEDQNIQFQHQTYENMKIVYLVLEPDVEKPNNAMYFSILDKNSQNALKAKKLNYFGNKVEAWKIFGSQLIQELRIFEIYNFRLAGEQIKPFYVNHAIICKKSSETVESATELVYRIKNGEPKFVVVSGEAGIGKSTTLMQIAWELQQKQQHIWIVIIDYSQIECQLTESQTLDSEVSALMLIRNVELDKLEDNNEVLQKLFDQKVKMNEMVLLIDSFDKISPQYKAEANKLIELLRQTGIQMIVTSRPHEDNNFSEDETFELQQFNTESKRFKFLKQTFETYKIGVPQNFRAWLEKKPGDVTKTIWNNPSSLVSLVSLSQIVMPPGFEKNSNFLYNCSIANTLGNELKENESNALEKLAKFDHLLRVLAICAVFHDGKVQDEYKDEISENGSFINSFLGIVSLKSDYESVYFLQTASAHWFVATIFIQQYSNNAQNPKLSIEQQKSVLMDKKHFLIRRYICGFLSESQKFDFALNLDVIQGNEKKLLHLVIEEDCLELFLLLKEQLKVAHQNYVMETSDSAEKINLLYLAMKSSRKEFVKQLLDDGAAFESVLQEEFVLHKALDKRLYKEVRFHIDALKKDINKADDRSNFPLHYVAQNGSKEMVEFLIANGANVNLANASNQTALYFAIEADSDEVVNVLLLKNGDRKIALKWAAELGRENLFEKLYKEKTNVDDLKDNLLQEAISLAATFGQFNMIFKLLFQEIEPIALNEEGETSMHLAAAGGHLKCFRLLWNKSLSFDHVDIRNSKGETPLMKALLNGHEEMVEWLLERNADLQAENAEGTKVSHYMAAYVLSKTVPTEELNDFKKVLKPSSNSEKSSSAVSM